MAEDKNPEEKKPSFFDFSDEESSSWPPKDSVPIEDDGKSEIPLSAFMPEEDPSPEPVASAAEPEEFDVEDLFSDDFAEATSPEPEAIVEPEPELTIEPEPPSLELPDLVPIEPSPEPESETKPSPLEDLLPDFEPIQKSEPELDFKEAPSLNETELNFGEMQAEVEASINKEPVIEEDDEGLISITDPLSEAIDDGFEKDSVDALYSDYSAGPAEEVESLAKIIDETEQTLPFRTFTTYDYNEAGLTEAELGEAEEEKPGINRNVLIVLAVLLLIGGWYGFKAMFSKDYNANRTRERKTRKAASPKIALQEKELIPVWDLSNQTFSSVAGENILIKDMFYEAGRENPFMLPDSVLADMVKAAELDLIKNQKPNTYRRTAYRATLIGVLTSTKNTIALVDYQEAVFDVLEDTSKEKILKLAVKAMDKTKENTQEMIIGSYIGPWKITKIDAPEDPFIEPRITIENDHQTKELSMGKATELGIFDDDGNFDNLEDPVDETALNDFKW